MRYGIPKIFGLNESGKALLELAIVAPLILGIALPSIDAVNFARAGHLLNTVTREAGRGAFSCAYLNGDVRTCIETTVAEALPSNGDSVVQNAEITVSVWQHQTAPAGPLLISTYQRGNLNSRISAARISTLNSYNDKKERILIVETRIPFNPITPFFQNERYLVTVM